MKKKLLALISTAQIVSLCLSLRKKYIQAEVKEYAKNMRLNDYEKMKKSFVNNSSGVSVDLNTKISTKYFEDVNEFLIDNLSSLTYKIIKTKKVRKGVYKITVKFSHVDAKNIIEDVLIAVIENEKEITDENKIQIVDQLVNKEDKKLKTSKEDTEVVFTVGKTKHGYKIFSVTKNLDKVYTSNYM